MTSLEVDWLLGRRWTARIVMVMLEHDGTMRFTELIDAVPGLSKRLLTERLTELETAGLVDRHVPQSDQSPSATH
ncbi:winged helix-turn-helix transcriptional regulator [Smaragdicoccus niigatensis]|uniref:winged helix-turn-helix transcriptional regulator n=1 Tax=Smaragdicoccus niigatensis TaxID=359359 RepID=UPI0012DDCBE5|nr:winged helix-turn-helix transcriptional regulator [Smaragdicoccus niigatensis]